MKALAALLALGVLILLHAAPLGAVVAAQPLHVSVQERRAVSEVPAWETSASEVSRGGLPRGYALVAYEVTRTFPPEQWITFTEIGIAESCGDPARVGDVDTPFQSYGLFQIRAAVHPRLMKRLTGSDRLVDWVAWLDDPGNNAEAALAIWRGPRGLDNWGSWTDGRTELFREAAQQSLMEVK